MKIKTHKEFFEIEDKLLKKLIYVKGYVNNIEDHITYTQNGNDIIFNKYQTRLKFHKNNFYTKNKEIYTIRFIDGVVKVYGQGYQYDFYRYFFRFDTRILLQFALTKGLIKRILTNKINCLDDFLNYYKSYHKEAKDYSNAELLKYFKKRYYMSYLTKENLIDLNQEKAYLIDSFKYFSEEIDFNKNLSEINLKIIEIDNKWKVYDEEIT